MPILRSCLVATLVLTALGCFRTPPPTTPRMAPTAKVVPPDAKVKLAVLVVFDQLRGDYLARWQPQFGVGGFNRLMTDGAWYANCHYPYATTTTGPGHASILTGCSAEKHGIINNNWFDREAGEDVYCAGATRYRTIPALPKTLLSSVTTKPTSAGCPDRLLASTVADSLKDATSGRGKVVGLSLKDRGAILPSGREPDAVYWFDDRLCTSTYYRDSVHSWVAAYNRSKTADRFFGKPWDRFRPTLNYDRLAGPDDGSGEGSGTKQGKVFPHPTTGGLREPGPAYYTAVETSPYGNELLLDVAKRAILAESLGVDDVPDLLTVSFSSNDLIGHTWGPDSHEVLDVTLRSDAIMAELLTFLDDTVGKGNYLVLLTADHGVCPIPEGLTKRGEVAGRVSVKDTMAGLYQHLLTRFPAAATRETPLPQWFEAVSLPHLYLNRKLLKAKNLDENEVANVAAEWLRTQPNIANTYTRKQLTGPIPADDKFGQMAKKSYYPDRSGELYVILKSHYLPGSGSTGTGTTHGSPYEYDTHVPLLAFGPGIPGGKRTDRVTPQHAAPIAAQFLGVNRPDHCDTTTPETLLKP